MSEAIRSGRYVCEEEVCANPSSFGLWETSGAKTRRDYGCDRSRPRLLFPARSSTSNRRIITKEEAGKLRLMSIAIQHHFRIGWDGLMPEVETDHDGHLSLHCPTSRQHRTRK